MIHRARQRHPDGRSCAWLAVEEATGQATPLHSPAMGLSKSSGPCSGGRSPILTARHLRTSWAPVGNQSPLFTRPGWRGRWRVERFRPVNEVGIKHAGKRCRAQLLGPA